MKEPQPDPVESKPLLDDRTQIQRFGFAIAATLIAFLIRWSLDGFLGKQLPYGAFIIATTLVAWFGGFLPSVVTFACGFLLANWFFVDPRHEISFNNTNNISQGITTLIVGLTIIFFGRSMHLARRRANANARQAIAHQKQLEQEVIERKRAEEQVRRLNVNLELLVQQRTAELVATNQELEMFTFSVSHDLRAPLRHVDGYAQMLEEDFGGQIPAEAREYLKKIRQGSQNMRQLVDDLLKLSHIGKAELSRQPTSLKPLVDEVISDLKSETASRQIEWRVGDLLPADCDPGLVKQVFANLLSNAAKYTRPRPEAHIEVGQVKTNGETAFFVRDNGVGFNMSYVGKLFGVFQRLHRPEEFEGTGVGLATVARIVHKHGGRVWAEGELNKGATFYFTLAGANGNGHGSTSPHSANGH